MARDLAKPRLRVPALLAVTTLGLASGCPGDDATDTGNDSGPSPTSTSASTDENTTAMTSAGTTVAMTTGDSTGAMGTDTGGLPNCQAAIDEARCTGTPDCVYMPELGGCIINCPIVEDEATCIAEVGCEWFGDTCDFEPLA